MTDSTGNSSHQGLFAAGKGFFMRKRTWIAISTVALVLAGAVCVLALRRDKGGRRSNSPFRSESQAEDLRFPSARSASST
jgi:hypothetical protein